MMPFHFYSGVPKRGVDAEVVVPAGIASKAELFAFLQRAIPLPDYFGHNWDALVDCLGDWGLSDERMALVHEDVPLAGFLGEQRVYLEILEGVARMSESISVHFPEESKGQIVELLREHSA